MSDASTGVVKITGTAGPASTSSTAATSNNSGVRINGSSTEATSSNGNLSINGTGGGTGSNNYGVDIEGGAHILVPTPTCHRSAHQHHGHRPGQWPGTPTVNPGTPTGNSNDGATSVVPRRRWPPRAEACPSPVPAAAPAVYEFGIDLDTGAIVMTTANGPMKSRAPAVPSASAATSEST